MSIRKTAQHLPPVKYQPTTPGSYDIYPAFPLAMEQIEVGFEALAIHLSSHTTIIIDGYVGVLWESFRAQLDAVLRAKGISLCWHPITDALHSTAKIEQMIAPYLGEDDPIFGSRYPGHVSDFFDLTALAGIQPDALATMNIIYGTGAALAGWNGFLVYLDVPKNEIQFRSRASSITNLGAPTPGAAKAMYKRYYFIDWPVLNQHKATLLESVDLIVDEQRPDTPVFTTGDALRATLHTISRSYFRVRPWFEPGVWGGHWMMKHIPQLPQNTPNLAWSFELITPENGLMLTSGGLLCEISFDWLMFYDHRAVLGDCAKRFGTEFPLRFDYLDTFDGDNLSLQVHPRTDYIIKHFGETYTQDETYYILDCKPGAQVYLGFKDDINIKQFRNALECALQDAVPVDVERFVNVEPAKKGDFFLIPSGTVHCSGVGNLVLEISATPYIFTFKMYDWMRLDLDGKPRPLNIERAFDNLDFDQHGERVKHELISQPVILEQGDTWQIEHLPTHPQHFYDVHRLTFLDTLEVETMESFHALNLVDGEMIWLEMADGRRQHFNYAESFVVTAAASRYRLINTSNRPVKVIKAFVKPL